MELTCQNKKCKNKFLVRGAFYWRYPGRVNKCPECGGKGKPDKKGQEEIKSRHLSVNQNRKP